MSMMQTVIRLGVMCALVIGVAATANAQSDQANANRQQPKKEKRQANQVPDNGAGEATAQAADNTFERVVSAVPVTVRGDGTIFVELNDSFMEAETATVGADGSLHYAHVTGMDRASALVRAQSAKASLLPSRALPVVFPNYPEK
jgi:hypothetical protein